MIITYSNGSVIITYTDKIVKKIDASLINRIIKNPYADTSSGDVFLLFSDDDREYATSNTVERIPFDEVTSPIYADLDALYDALSDYKDLYNGSTIAAEAVVTASINQAEYKSPNDMTVAYTNSSTITASALSGFSISEDSQIVGIKVVPVDTAERTRSYGDGNGYTFRHSSGVITAYYNGAVASIFTANDSYMLGINSQKKAYDPNTQLDKVHANTGANVIKEDPNYSETLSATAKSYYLIPLKGFKGGTITVRATMGAGSTGIWKIYNSANKDINTSTITIADWLDDSLDILGAVTVATPAAQTTDHIIHLDTNMGTQFLLLEMDYTHAANSTIEIESYINY